MEVPVAGAALAAGGGSRRAQQEHRPQPLLPQLPARVGGGVGAHDERLWALMASALKACSYRRTAASDATGTFLSSASGTRSSSVVFVLLRL